MFFTYLKDFFSDVISEALSVQHQVTSFLTIYSYFIGHEVNPRF